MQIGWAMPAALAALAGVVLGHWAPPGLFESWALAMLMAVRRPKRVMMMAALGWTASCILLSTGAELPEGLSRQDLRLEGRVVSSEFADDITRLRFRVDRCRPLSSYLPSCDKLDLVKLSLYGDQRLRTGERWSLTTRLRPPGGFSNPHTFNYRAWLWREGIGATGYVRDEPMAERLASAPWSLRQAALAYLDEQELGDRTRRWLAALSLGAGERLADDDWKLLNGSGTTHLVVISGLHVGLIAAGMLMICRGIARLLMPEQWRLTVWPWWAAGLTAAGYAGLAGLEPPALRAMIMTIIGLWVASGRHAPGVWQAWWLALALVIIIDPLSAWRPGLWLSFLAVGLLIVVWQGRSRPRGVRGWLWALLRTQWLLAPLMAGAALLAFQRLAPVAPLVNLVAVPWVSSILVPLGLLGWLLAWAPPLAEVCWSGFELASQCLQTVLASAVTMIPAWTPPHWMIMPLSLSLMILSACWSLPGLHRTLRWGVSLVLLLFPLTLEAPTPAADEIQVRIQDVGQGLAIDLQTRSHRALYDLGPKFRSGFMPLESLWPPGRHFDRVIVSHGDMDHAGGLDAMKSHTVAQFMAPAGESLAVSTDACRRGDAWQWDGVRFRFLWPPADSSETLTSNDRSCVLLVASPRRRLLITGDVGHRVERQLLDSLEGPVDVLVAGHHGSKTSSGRRFLEALSPRHVVFSAGRDNPFGHPDDTIVRRFRQQGSCLWSTASDGALTLTMDGSRIRIVAERPPAGGVGSHCHQVESMPNSGLPVD
ncbi:DNA internalization-related competence protein ComEC/Rec2 [Aidingimonas halophila]|uniref:Competence protein ComEC n=1 Tax=Aidingimonas halophila TaxID=574349 RepID=A0A1H2QPH5_9GAMM|nr:DNA internalization-related competence protein ComEC/Rec2 [Aidingimonas halophila]SDW09097.1 competence protein ComEC [Aidingimonas halophila]